MSRLLSERLDRHRDDGALREGDDRGWANISATHDAGREIVPSGAAQGQLRGQLERLRFPRFQVAANTPGLVHHSDRGSPYASDNYRAKLREHGVRRSMSRKGDCWDNAVAESFFATLRAELVEHVRYSTRQAATTSVGDYIDNFYNVERRHSHLGYLNPIEFELRSQTHQSVA